MQPSGLSAASSRHASRITYANPLRERHNLDGMAIKALGVWKRGVDSIDNATGSEFNQELDTMVTRFIRSLQPGKIEVEILYQQFLRCAQEASNQIRANEERRRSTCREESNVNV